VESGRRGGRRRRKQGGWGGKGKYSRVQSPFSHSLFCIRQLLLSSPYLTPVSSASSTGREDERGKGRGGGKKGREEQKWEKFYNIFISKNTFPTNPFK